MGAYDEDEHERREAKNHVEVSEDDTRTTYEGSVEYDSGDSADELLEQFEQIKN